MKKGLVLGVVALLGFAGTAFAGLPCAAYSACNLSIQNVVGCGTADMVWTSSQLADYIVIRVTVRDCLENPVEACDVRLDLSGSFDSNVDVDPTNAANFNGRICGTATRIAATNANGAVAFNISGGGAGAVFLNWTVTAQCADPEVPLCANSDTLCAKSYNYNGDTGINFFDTFKYLPALNAGVGYSSDFAQCSTANGINFFDTFRYLPRLNNGDSCVEGFNLTKVNNVLECDTIF
ncbi:MAG: hypothetical protein ABIK65_08415 [Candidatus Eisenbacteria bacterium]